jgi:hypothetical protein
MSISISISISSQTGPRNGHCRTGFVDFNQENRHSRTVPLGSDCMRGLGDGARFNSHAVGEHFAMNNRSPLDDGNHTCSLERR